jgi:hypothetical protein
MQLASMMIAIDAVSRNLVAVSSCRDTSPIQVTPVTTVRGRRGFREAASAVLV